MLMDRHCCFLLQIAIAFSFLKTYSTAYSLLRALSPDYFELESLVFFCWYLRMYLEWGRDISTLLTYILHHGHM